eukprot:5764380-Alexandrium_andersonii.AAC.1
MPGRNAPRARLPPGHERLLLAPQSEQPAGVVPGLENLKAAASGPDGGCCGGRSRLPSGSAASELLDLVSAPTRPAPALP